jgi:hypothetical protein
VSATIHRVAGERGSTTTSATPVLCGPYGVQRFGPAEAGAAARRRRTGSRRRTSLRIMMVRR